MAGAPGPAGAREPGRCRLAPRAGRGLARRARVPGGPGVCCSGRARPAAAGVQSAGSSGGGRRLAACRAAASAESQAVPELNGVVDYYELLGVDDDAPPGEIKAAYRSLAKECHPDYLGNEGHNICVLLNEAYEVLSDAQQRAAYNARLQEALMDAMDDFTGRAYSKWLPGTKMGRNADPGESRAVFVDECTCVGCKQCVWLAPGVFRIEPEYGRSRVFAQWANAEDEIEAAIESCPVDCIAWVEREQLPALEYVTRFRTKREGVAAMMAGAGSSVDVYDAAARFMKARRRRDEERQRAARRSEAAEAARREAAAALLRRRGGWAAGFSARMEAALNGMLATVGPGSRGGGREEQAATVGHRKRQRNSAEPGSDLTGATIPVERSLVIRS